jgi:polysaccharide biosynthesis protein PelG
MAGIGFELKRVVEKGGVTSFLKAAFSGIMIVAGPWIISILSIYIISRLLTFLPGVEQQLFIAVVIYSYSFSLILFGGLHYIFTRLIADLIYVKKPKTASSLLVFFVLIMGTVSAGLGVAAFFFSGIDTPYPWMLRAAGGLLFGSVNCVWIVMLFVSLIKWYGRILLVYLGGMGISVAGMFLLAKPFGIAGAVMGIAVGHFIIFMVLLIFCLHDYPAGKFGQGKEQIGPYFKKHKLLFLTGQMYNMGIWGDKILFWFLAGSSIGNTLFYLFPSYDIAVYIGTLSMIPGLVFFVIGTEPDIFVYVKKFLLSLNTSELQEIQAHKYNMLKWMRIKLLRLTLFGFVIMVCAILFIPSLLNWFGFETTPVKLILSFSAVFAHLCFLSYMNILFYLNYYRRTCIAAFLFFSINMAVSLGLGITGLLRFSGAGYLAGAVAAGIYSFISLLKEGRKIDRYILSAKYV